MNNPPRNHRSCGGADIDSMTREELRAYINGLRERRRSLIRCQCTLRQQCDECNHEQSGDQSSPTD